MNDPTHRSARFHQGAPDSFEGAPGPLIVGKTPGNDAQVPLAVLTVRRAFVHQYARVLENPPGDFGGAAEFFHVQPAENAAFGHPHLNAGD